MLDSSSRLMSCVSLLAATTMTWTMFLRSFMGSGMARNNGPAFLRYAHSYLGDPQGSHSRTGAHDPQGGIVVEIVGGWPRHPCHACRCRVLGSHSRGGTCENLGHSFKGFSASPIRRSCCPNGSEDPAAYCRSGHGTRASRSIESRHP